MSRIQEIKNRTITTSDSNNVLPNDEPQRLFLWVPTLTIMENDTNHSITDIKSDIIHQIIQNHQSQITTTLQQNILLPKSAWQQLESVSNNNNHNENKNHHNKMNIVQSVNDIVEAVNQHYSTDDTINHQNQNDQPPQRQFVGGMGEQDLGVYFISLPLVVNHNKNNNTSSTTTTCTYQDILNHSSTIQLIQESIEQVKAIRHGVPFGIYTSGIIHNHNHNHDNAFPPLNELDMDVYEVSLFGGGNGNPTQYHHYITNTIGRINSPKDDFYRICQFITTAVEVQEQNVEVSLLASSTSSSETKESTQLALSLGARHVHVYTKE